MNGAATIPDGVVGNYHLIVRTDLNNQVDELYLEGDNTTVSGGTFPVTLRDYPDLVVESLTITPPACTGSSRRDRSYAPLRLLSLLTERLGTSLSH